MTRNATIITVLLLASGIAASEPQRTITASIEIAAEPEAAIRAFLDDSELRGWWKVSRSLVEPGPDGVWSISWDDWGADKTQHAWTGVIRELRSNRVVIGHLVMNEPDRPLFGPLELQIDAVATPRGSLVTVRHKGYRTGPDWDWLHDVVVAGWDHVLGDLRDWFSP